MTKKQIGWCLLIVGIVSAVLTEVLLLPESPWTRSKVDTWSFFFEFPLNVLLLSNAVVVVVGGFMSGFFGR